MVPGTIHSLLSEMGQAVGAPSSTIRSIVIAQNIDDAQHMI